MRQGATFPKLVGLWLQTDLLGWEMSPSKGQAPDKGTAVSHHSQDPAAVGGAGLGGKEDLGGCQQPPLQFCSLVWDNIITHVQHMFCSRGQELCLVLLMLSLQSLVKPVMNR